MEIAKSPGSGQTKSTAKRKLYEDGAPLTTSDSTKKATKKAMVNVTMATQGTPTLISVPKAQVGMSSRLQSPTSNQAPLQVHSRGREGERGSPIKLS